MGMQQDYGIDGIIGMGGLFPVLFPFIKPFPSIP